MKGVAMFPRRYLLLIVCLLMIPGQPAPSQPPVTEGRKVPEPGKAARIDLLGDPLPSGAIARLGTSRLCQPDAYRKAFSPDATRLAALTYLSDPPCLRLWDVGTGKELWRVELPAAKWPNPGPLSSPVFSPDGKTVALGYPHKSIRLWDTATGRERQRLTGHEGIVTALAFSPDGKELASVVDTDMTIRFWNLATGKERQRLVEEPGWLRAIAFSADGKTLVAMRSTFRLPHTNIWTASFWGVTTGKERRGETFDTQDGRSPALSPDARYFAVQTADDKSILLLDPATGKELRRTAGEGNRLSNVAFSADGRSMTASSGDGIVRVWDVDTGKLRHQFKALSGGVTSLTLSRDGGLVALNGSGAPTCLRIYDVARGKEVHDFPGHRSIPLTLAFARDGKTVITADPRASSQPATVWADWSFRVWDAATGKELRVTQVDPGGEVRLVVISPDARLIATVIHDGTIRLWDVATGKEVQRWKGPTWEVKWQVGKEWKKADYTAVQQAAFSADGQTFMTPDKKGSILRWDTATGKELPPIETPLPANSTFPSPDGKTMLVSAHDPKAYPDFPLLLLDTASGRLLRNLDIIDSKTRKSFFTNPLFHDYATASGDGRTWAVRGEVAGPVGPKLILFETATGQRRGVVESKSGISAQAFSPDGRLLVIGGDQLSCWDLGTGRTMGHAPSPGGYATSLAFSPNGKRLAVGGRDSAALVYDVDELLKDKIPAPGKLSAADLEGLWKDLSASGAVRAYQAIHRLSAASEGVALLKERLKPLPASEEKRLAGLLVDLNNDDFNVREKATRELEEMGRQAEPALRKVLDGKPSPEVRTRVDGLLKKLTPGGAANSSADVIGLRALEALEMAGTAEARQIIKGLAGGSADAPLTDAAKAALERLAARAGAAP
jgi:WD40 repeat protein